LQQDSYAFGVIIIECIIGLPARAVVGMMMDDAEVCYLRFAALSSPTANAFAQFFDRMDEHKDARAGQWPQKAVTELARVAESCLEHRARQRCTVRDVVAKLKVLKRLSA
jgi:hypothetical protein